MVIDNPKLLSFLDQFVIDRCKQITPDVNLEEIGKNLSVFSFEKGVSTVFYLEEYIMTIDWRIIK